MSEAEKEVKILEIDQQVVKQKLEALGAQVIFDGMMDATFYDYPDSALEHKDQLLRLRKEGDETELVFKQKKYMDNYRDNQEISVKVEDYEKMKKIFETIGLHPTKVTRKHRIEYKLDKVKIAIDTYHDHMRHIPTFMEIEGKEEAAIFKYAKTLGFSEKDFCRWSTKELAEHYSQQKK